MNFSKFAQEIYFYLLVTTYMTRSKTRKSRKTRNFFSEIFKSEFSILAVGQNRKLGNNGIIFPRFPRFPRFPSFQFASFHFSKTFFFQYSTVGNSLLLIYVVLCFQSRLNCFFPTPKIYIQNIILS